MVTPSRIRFVIVPLQGTPVFATTAYPRRCRGLNYRRPSALQTKFELHHFDAGSFHNTVANW
jgi:hypothetical protein